MKGTVTRRVHPCAPGEYFENSVATWSTWRIVASATKTGLVRVPGLRLFFQYLDASMQSLSVRVRESPYAWFSFEGTYYRLMETFCSRAPWRRAFKVVPDACYCAAISRILVLKTY